MKDDDGVTLVPEDNSWKITAPPPIGGGLSRIVNQEWPESDQEECSECFMPVRVMAFKGMGVCGEICRKKRDGELVE